MPADYAAIVLEQTLTSFRQPIVGAGFYIGDNQPAAKLANAVETTRLNSIRRDSPT